MWGSNGGRITRLVVLQRFQSDELTRDAVGSKSAFPPGTFTGIDMDNCDSKKFDVSRFVFNVANRCQYANDYRKVREMLFYNANLDSLIHA